MYWRRILTRTSSDLSYPSHFISKDKKVPSASFSYHTYGSIKVSPPWRQQCVWCIKWMTARRYDMRTYCCPLLTASENRTVARIRNIIWAISILTAVVAQLFELQKRLAGQPRAWMGSHVDGWKATCIHATCSCCSGISLQQRRVMGDGSQACKATRDYTRMALPAAAGHDRGAGCSVLFALLLLFCAERTTTATNSR